MTTIAWDGKTLAGDSYCISGGFIFYGAKIWRLSNGCLFGAAGNAEDCEAVRMWLEVSAGAVEPHKKPEVKDFVGILIATDGRCYRMEDKLVSFEVTSPFHAIGSGRDYAVAAMHLGETAREAVELASVFDCYTGGHITELTLAA